MRRVVFAAADKSNIKWGALSAISLEINNNRATLIATDQTRASIAHVDIISNIKGVQYLVSIPALSLIPRVFGDTTILHVDKQKALIFTDETSSLFIRLMHGNFPEVADFIPKTHPNTLIISPTLFLKQVQKAALAAESKSGFVKIILTKDKLSLHTKEYAQHKSAKIEHQISYSGPDFQFGVHCKKIIELMKAADQDQDIEMKFNNNRQPLLFKQNNFEHFLVPLETR